MVSANTTALSFEYYIHKRVVIEYIINIYINIRKVHVKNNSVDIITRDSMYLSCSNPSLLSTIVVLCKAT